MGQEILEKLKKLNVIISGQILTSRTETIEEYYRDKVHYLAVIGITNPYLKGPARCRLYENGKLQKEYPLFRIHLKGIYWLNQLLMAPVFTLYAFSMFLAVLRLRKKFDLFIGIACFSTLFGIVLKKLGLVKNVVYYTLDYYPKPAKLHINTIINKSIWYLDRYCCKKSSQVWNISPRIPEARKTLMNFSSDRYNHILVPLTYSEKILRFRRLQEIEQNTLIFVGTLSWNQGLQLVIESMPELVKLNPRLKVRIIGKGVAGNEIKRMIDNNNLSDRFIFHGFVEKEEDMLDIISRSAIGICPWTDETDNNAIYADPGKPKLYAFCGLPIVITKVTAIAKEIDDMKAGIAIDYNRQQFVNAVLKILENEETLEKYRQNAHSFAVRYTSENIFGNVTKELMHAMENHKRN